MRTNRPAERENERNPADPTLPTTLNKDERALIKLLELEPTPGATDGSYSRKGYTGRYFLQRENGNSSVFFSGGTGPDGKQVLKQTFFYMPWTRLPEQGQWRADFNSPVRPLPLEPAEKQAQESRILDRLQLKPDPGGEDGAFVRDDYPGKYYLQRERTGEYSVWYSGGKTEDGRQCPPCTFARGRWHTLLWAPVDESLLLKHPQAAARAALPRKF